MLRTFIIALALPFSAFATAPCPPVHVDAVTGERPPPCLSAWLDEETAELEITNGCAEPARIRLTGVDAPTPTAIEDSTRRFEVGEDGGWVLDPGEGSHTIVPEPRPNGAETTMTLEWSVGREAGAQQWVLVDLCAGGGEPESCSAVPGSGVSGGAALLLLLAALRRRR